MPLELHTLEMTANPPSGMLDRVMLGTMTVSNVSGSTSVATSVTWPNTLPATYSVHVTPSQNAGVAVSAKTSTGFTVTLYATSVSAGTFDVTVIA